ncbi:MAG: LysR family transcriptional regulator [Rhodobacteraceae bacterium]|nr:LysR family transcriptional regulator [Paracoccaceae bacterium]
MSDRLDLDALRALVAIADQGGVTRAAEQLALSQSAVSHKIKRLETALDCKLLARRAGGPLFTDAGGRLLDYARRMSDLHDEALAALGRKNVAGTITLGMTEDTTTSGIARILGRFTRTYPDIQVKIRTSQSLNVQDWLRAGEIDLAVMQLFRRDLKGSDMILFDDTLHWVKSPDLILDPDQPVPFLAFDDQCFYKHWGFRDGQGLGHRFDTLLECPSAAGIQSAVRSGLGVALLNGLHVTPDMEIVEGLFPVPPDIAYIARVHPRRRSPAVKALIAEIAREVDKAIPLRVAG